MGVDRGSAPALGQKQTDGLMKTARNAPKWVWLVGVIMPDGTRRLAGAATNAWTAKQWVGVLDQEAKLYRLEVSPFVQRVRADIMLPWAAGEMWSEQASAT